MLRTFAYSISLLLLISGSKVQGQDTIKKVSVPDTVILPLKIRIGLEASGPAIHYADKNILNAEAYISVDLTEKRSVFLDAGYLNFKYSQYNYSYLDKGIFVRAGMDFNILKPEKSMGKYWAGIGLSYAISRFNSETPFLEKENYWGSTSTSLPQKKYWGHFIEISPGVRSEIFKNFSMGWSINMKLLVHTGTGKDLKSIYMPGFGDATKTITAGITYFLVWNIPYKKLTVIIKKEPPPEEDEDNTDTTAPGTNSNNSSNNSSKNSGTSGTNQQGRIRY